MACHSVLSCAIAEKGQVQPLSSASLKNTAPLPSSAFSVCTTSMISPGNKPSPMYRMIGTVGVQDSGVAGYSMREAAAM
eukprot:20149-Heterococcus_DN1.PRE.4